MKRARGRCLYKSYNRFQSCIHFRAWMMNEMRGRNTQSSPSCTVLLVQVQNVVVILEVVFFHVPYTSTTLLMFQKKVVMFFCRKIHFLTNHIMCKTVHGLTSQKTIKCVFFGRNGYKLLYNLWWSVKRQAQKSLWDRTTHDYIVFK